jgi:hypothetical protein
MCGNGVGSRCASIAQAHGTTACPRAAPTETLSACPPSSSHGTPAMIVLFLQVQLCSWQLGRGCAAVRPCSVQPCYLGALGPMWHVEHDGRGACSAAAMLSPLC